MRRKREASIYGKARSRPRTQPGRFFRKNSRVFFQLWPISVFVVVFVVLLSSPRGQSTWLLACFSYTAQYVQWFCGCQGKHGSRLLSPLITIYTIYEVPSPYNAYTLVPYFSSCWWDSLFSLFSPRRHSWTYIYIYIGLCACLYITVNIVAWSCDMLRHGWFSYPARFLALCVVGIPPRVSRRLARFLVSRSMCKWAFTFIFYVKL